MDTSYDQWRKARCKGMIRSYLEGHRKTSLAMVLAFMRPPHEKPLPRETVRGLLQQVLLEGRHPVVERLALLKRMLGLE